MSTGTEVAEAKDIAMTAMKQPELYATEMREALKSLSGGTLN